MPTSCASISAWPVARRVSSTRCARRAKSSSETGRFWQAFRTPLMTFSRLKGSAAPLRLMIDRTAVSWVEKRAPQTVHSRRRRIVVPSSEGRESMTRDSSFRQKGQFTACLFLSMLGISRYWVYWRLGFEPQLMEAYRKLTPTSRGKSKARV